VVPFVMHMLSRGPVMLHRTMTFGALLVFSGALIRMIPTFVGGSLLHSNTAVWFLHAGQLLNGMAGPMAAATPSAFSVIWVTPDQRTLATSVAYIPAVLGPAGGFLLALAVGDLGHPLPIPGLLSVELASSATALCLWLAMPYQPALPPSATAAAQVANSLESPPDLWQFLHLSRRAVTNGSFLLVAVSGGVVAGVFSCWSGSLPGLLPQLDESESAMLAFSSNLACLLGTVCIGPIADRWFPQRYKLCIVLLFIAQVGLYVVFSISLPFGPYQNLLPTSVPLLFVSLGLASALLGATTPLCYELAAELTYPAPEGISAGLLSFLNNVGGLILMVIMPNVPDSYSSIMMTASVLLCLGLVCFATERYLRSDEDKVEAQKCQPAV